MKNKSGIASALISVLLIVSFFMPFTYYEGTSISTFKVISELASHGVLGPSWFFYIYFGLVVVNVFVQLINGNRALYSFVGGTGFGLMVLFATTFQSYDVEEGIFKVLVLNESPGFGVLISGLLALALVFVPQCFEDEKEKTKPMDLSAEHPVKSTMSELEALKEEAEELKSKLAQRKAEKEKDERERIEKEKLKEEIARLKKELGENEERI